MPLGHPGGPSGMRMPKKPLGWRIWLQRKKYPHVYMFTNPGQLLAGFVIPHHHLWPWQCAHLKGMVVIGEGVDDRHTAVARQLLQVPGRGPPPRGGGEGGRTRGLRGMGTIA